MHDLVRLQEEAEFIKPADGKRQRLAAGFYKAIYGGETYTIMKKLFSLRRTAAASMTIEAAVVLSVFMFAMSMFLTIFPAMNISLRIQAAMEEASESVAMYTYGLRALGDLEISQSVLSELGWTNAKSSDGSFMSQEDWNDLISQASAMLWLHARILKIVGEENLDNSCIRLGSKGLTTFGSSLPDEEDRFILKVSYLVKFPFSIGIIPDLPVTQQCCWRAWTGADKGRSKKTSEEETKELVYVTERGTVYHTTTSCPYLDLTIRSVAASSVGGLRSKNGSKYRPCERCTDYSVGTGSVYITDYGNRYHVDKDCGGLKRMVKALEKEEVTLPACKKCAKEPAKDAA